MLNDFGTLVAIISQLNTQPACAPVNASMVALRLATHDSGSGWDDVPAHPYAVAMETVRLAPNSEVSLYPWKDSQDHIQQAVRHVRTFLRAHQPVEQPPNKR
jgi:hypothetical protein